MSRLLDSRPTCSQPYILYKENNSHPFVHNSKVSVRKREEKKGREEKIREKRKEKTGKEREKRKKEEKEERKERKMKEK
jgi:hypothetical protein